MSPSSSSYFHSNILQYSVAAMLGAPNQPNLTYNENSIYFQKLWEINHSCWHCFFVFLVQSLGKQTQVSAVISLKHRPLVTCTISCKHSCTSPLHRKKKKEEEKKKHIWKQACGGSGWREEDRLALSRGKGQTTFSSHSYERCVTLNTGMGVIRKHTCFKPQICVFPQGSVDSGTAAVRVQDNRPSYQQQDRQTSVVVRP